MDACEFLFETLAIQGGSQYGEESVSQLEHALQCAALAGLDGAPASLIVAALFHDIGHLISSIEREVRKPPFNDRHESKGAALLSRWFGSEVSEPVRLHVSAKRYLCAVDPTYQNRLSPASRCSLELQGASFDPATAKDFVRQPYAGDAVRLRRWDDMAKVSNLDVPRLDHYRRLVEGLATYRQAQNRAAV